MYNNTKNIDLQALNRALNRGGVNSRGKIRKKRRRKTKKVSISYYNTRTYKQKQTITYRTSKHIYLGWRSEEICPQTQNQKKAKKIKQKPPTVVLQSSYSRPTVVYNRPTVVLQFYCY